MKTSFHILAITAVLGLTAAHLQAVSLVDPGAESNISTTNPPTGSGQGWAFFNGGVFSNTVARSGTFSIGVVGGGGFGVPGALQQFAAAPGEVFTMTGFGLTTAALAPGATFAQLQITYFNGFGPGATNLGTVETSPGNAMGSAQINSTSPLNTWIPLSVTATAPTGTQAVQVFAITIDQTPAPIYFDDMTLTSTPEPGSLALVGLGSLAMLSRSRRRK